ncbi:uncharacterized protein LOC111623568 [Centruroides sculpturatus]|uniref:uncharacterized protein LOC111623568 n=1 Tax=Centruroides sculpturatus TaxID=218467 RepID=UPI000C6ED9C3|nr:uncharacterized protein LOC111623568 [Centruroides sculpturatus]
MPKKDGKKLLKDYIIPNLDNKRFNDKMSWIDEDAGIFGLQWIHKSNSRYSQADGKVYEEWSQLKRLWNPEDPKATSKAKQRFRAALRKQKNLEKIEHQKNYRKYQIKDIKEIRQQLERERMNCTYSYENDVQKYKNYFQVNYEVYSENGLGSMKSDYSDESTIYYDENAKNFQLPTDNYNCFSELYLDTKNDILLYNQEELFEEIEDQDQFAIH